MKIAFVSQPIDTVLPPYQNSVGACTYGAACSLAESHEVTVFASLDRHEGQSDFDSQGVRFRFLPSTLSDRLKLNLRSKLSKIVRFTSPTSTSQWLFPDYGRHVADELTKGEFDVIHLQHCSQYVPIIRKLNPRAKIDLQLHAEWFSQNKPATLEKRLQGLDLLSTVSDHITSKTKRDLPSVADRCETIYNGIDIQEFMAEKIYSPSANRQKQIVYAGGISPHKGIHVLLEAFRMVAQEDSRVQLNIIGPHGSYPLEETFDLNDPAWLKDIEHFYNIDVLSFIKQKLSSPGSKTDPYLHHLKAIIPENIAAQVQLLGLIPRPELIQHYYDSDVFVFPPIWDEGFGIPPVEAMAAGTAVVATRSGAVSETVVHGETGLLVGKKDPRGLADAILTLLHNDSLREKMGRAGKRRAFSNFTWRQAAWAMDRRYRTLCQSPLRSGTATENPSESRSHYTAGNLLGSSTS